jgi:hypothetical protein
VDFFQTVRNCFSPYFWGLKEYNSKNLNQFIKSNASNNAWFSGNSILRKLALHFPVDNKKENMDKTVTIIPQYLHVIKYCFCGLYLFSSVLTDEPKTLYLVGK